MKDQENNERGEKEWNRRDESRRVDLLETGNIMEKKDI